MAVSAAILDASFRISSWRFAARSWGTILAGVRRSAMEIAVNSASGVRSGSVADCKRAQATRNLAAVQVEAGALDFQDCGALGSGPMSPNQGLRQAGKGLAGPFVSAQVGRLATTSGPVIDGVHVARSVFVIGRWKRRSDHAFGCAPHEIVRVD